MASSTRAGGPGAPGGLGGLWGCGAKMRSPGRLGRAGGNRDVETVGAAVDGERAAADGGARIREAGGDDDGDDEFEFSDDIPDDETPVEAVAPRFKPSHPKKPVPRKKGPGRFAKPKE